MSIKLVHSREMGGKMKKGILVLLVVIFLASCSPSTSDVQTAIAETQAVLPTDTTSPTFTLTPTMTNTSTTTFTPTITDTATPIPPATLTQQVINATETQLSANTTATQQVEDSQATSTAKSITATAQAKSAQATEIASYITIPRKELITYSENYKGKKIKVNGRIFNIIGSVIQMYVDGDWDSALYVNLYDKPSGIYEDDWISVFGVVSDEECFKNIYDAEICQPALKNAWFTKP